MERRRQTYRAKVKERNWDTLKDVLSMRSAYLARMQIIPQSVMGSPLAQQNLIDNGMAVISHFGNPSFMITMTADPTWPEIKALNANSSPHTRIDLICRAFRPTGPPRGTVRAPRRAARAPRGAVRPLRRPTRPPRDAERAPRRAEGFPWCRALCRAARAPRGAVHALCRAVSAPRGAMRPLRRPTRPPRCAVRAPRRAARAPRGAVRALCRAVSAPRGAVRPLRRPTRCNSQEWKESWFYEWYE